MHFTTPTITARDLRSGMRRLGEVGLAWPAVARLLQADPRSTAKK